MKRSWLLRLKEWWVRRDSTPWAAFESNGIDGDGRLAFAIYHNAAFVKNLKAIGMTGTTDEEMVQMFFLQLRVIPEQLIEEEEGIVNPEATPQLTSDANRFVRG